MYAKQGKPSISLGDQTQVLHIKDLYPGSCNTMEGRGLSKKRMRGSNNPDRLTRDLLEPPIPWRKWDGDLS